MTQSPLHHRFAGTDALLIPYGSGGQTVEVVGAFEEVGLEYAAIRKGCALFDMPHAGTLVATGLDRLSFLNNMVTQKVVDMTQGQSRWSFWLNRKGRIDADLRLCERGDRTVIAVDRHLAPRSAHDLTNYVFSEEVAIEDASERFHRMALHGVGALAVLAAVTGEAELADLAPGTNAACEIAGVAVLAERDDLTGEPGVELCVPRDGAGAVYDALLAERPGTTPVKPVGWFAINTARIEAGRPVFNLDFGPYNLPMETGLVGSRIDFRKGCYLGQEVVARMDARKTRKQGLAAVRVMPDAPPDQAPLPGLGDRVFTTDDPEGNPIGAVTSSTVSPMLSAASVCFAMLRDAETKPGTRVVVGAEGRKVPAVVHDGLAFWSRSGR